MQERLPPPPRPRLAGMLPNRARRREMIGPLPIASLSGSHPFPLAYRIVAREIYYRAGQNQHEEVRVNFSLLVCYFLHNNLNRKQLQLSSGLKQSKYIQLNQLL